MNISRNLATGWAFRNVATKEKIQKLLFPSGIKYEFENQAFQTIETNDIFREIPRLNSVSGDDKLKQDGIKAILSCYVGTTGFEPATPTSRTWCATGLRYVPYGMMGQETPGEPENRNFRDLAFKSRQSYRKAAIYQKYPMAVLPIL